MSCGQHCKCNSCDFDFHNGHSHHSGFSQMLCVACLTAFALPTESPWGARLGELIVVHRLVREVEVTHKKKPPRITYRLEASDEFVIAESAGEWGVAYPITHIICPHCGRKGTMALDFFHGQTCPKCRLGTLDCCEVMY